MPKQISEMQFAGSDQEPQLHVNTHDDGRVVIGVSEQPAWLAYWMTLGQTIQLRDFLNRHIDELALKQTGSLAERSSDDPTQLAAVEEISHTGIGGVYLGPVRVERKWSVLGCGQPLPKPVGHAVNCGFYAETGDVFPELCPACRTASTKYTVDKSQP